jgi:hypothetical protein
VYDRCSLARELSHPRHRIPPADIATWVCIARHESDYNTSAVGHLDGASGDHGIFQISDRYWCSPPGRGKSCGLSCDLLEDDDLTDDVMCALRILLDHGHRDGDGFTAWAVYRPYCSGDVSEYVRGCGEDDESGVISTVNTPYPGIASAGTYNPAAHEYFTSPTPPPRYKQFSDSRVVYTGSTQSPMTTTLHPTSTPTQQGKYKPLKSIALKKYKKPLGDKFPHNVLSGVSDGSSDRSRSVGTGLSGRPNDLDSRTAWHRVHYDPRFLDES